MKYENNRCGEWISRFGVACLLLISACGKEDSKPEKTAPATQAPATAPAASRGSARHTIKGQVSYKGKVAPSMLTVTKDQEVCGNSKTDSTLVVSPDSRKLSPSPLINLKSSRPNAMSIAG